MKFRLLRDKYHRPLKHYDNKKKYVSDDVIETDRDLTKFNPVGDPANARFERLPDDFPASGGVPYRSIRNNGATPAASSQEEENTSPIAVMEREPVDLTSLSIVELRELAEEEQIDLGGAKGKRAIIKILQARLS